MSTALEAAEASVEEKGRPLESLEQVHPSHPVLSASPEVIRDGPSIDGKISDESPPSEGAWNGSASTEKWAEEMETAGTLLSQLDRMAAEVRQEVTQNSGTMIGIQLRVTLAQLEAQQLHPEYLRRVKKAFAIPNVPKYEAALARLCEPGAVVVLSGAPGSGRTTAATALLADLRDKAHVDVKWLPYGGDSEFPVRSIPRSKNCAYLMELPSDEEEFVVSARFGEILHQIKSTLEAVSSHLIVVTSPDQWARIRHGAPFQAIELPPPSARDVVLRGLLAEEPEFPATNWVDDPRIAGLLEEQGPSAAIEVMHLIIRAACSPRSDLLDEPNADRASFSGEEGETDFNQRVDNVVNARRSWRPQLLAWHKDPSRTSLHRNFMLVASALRGASVGDIVTATGRLMELFDEPKVELKGQQAPGVIESVDAIKARLTGQNLVTFPRPGWDDAVLDYFWVDRPLCQQAFRKWMSEVPQLVGASSAAARSIWAERMSELAFRWAVRTNRPADLADLVEAWHKREELWPAAVNAVALACIHPLIGRAAHAVLLEWAKFKSRPALQQMAVEQCAGAFGQANPGKAMVRLRHAAASPHPDIVEALRSAVGNLWRDTSLRGVLIKQVAAWCLANDDSSRVAGRRAFAALAELCDGVDSLFPALLAQGDAEPVVAMDALVAGWHALLDPTVDQSEAATAFKLWMDVCVTHPNSKYRVFTILRQAVGISAESSCALYVHRIKRLLWEWQPSPGISPDPARVSLRHELDDLVATDHSRALVLHHAHGVESP